MILISAAVALLMVQASFAQDSSLEGGTYSFNGSDIITEDALTIQNEISRLQPGDQIEITFHYNNDSDSDTEWYIRNDVLKTLEEQTAMNGGYSYSLVNYGETGTTPVFNSKAVGGEYGPDGIAKGLKGATDATGEFFHIDSLKTGQGGKTVLKVGLDGESQANIYQDTNGEILVKYAVETAEEPETIYENNKVRTGDGSHLLLGLFLMAAAVIALILALRSFRKDGEKA